jgi:hypothetical protein
LEEAEAEMQRSAAATPKSDNSGNGADNSVDDHVVVVDVENAKMLTTR